MKIKNLLLLGISAYGSFCHAAELSSFQLAGTTDKVYGLIQAWNISNAEENSTNRNFRLRRAQFQIDTTYSPQWGSFLVIDLARFAQNSPTPVPFGALFVDVGVKFTSQISGLEFKLGQFKAPTTAEGMDSSSSLSLPERSLVGRTFGDLHLLGAQASYRVSSFFKVSTMMTSGQSVIGTDPFHVTAFVSRIEINPFQDFSIGGFVYLQNFSYREAGRWGVNARYIHKKIDLRLEYTQARDFGVQSHGFTSEVGYWTSENIEPVARYELFSPNQSWETPATAQTVGLNYFIMKPNAKVQLAGSILQNMIATNGSPVAINGINNKIVTIGLQAQI